MTVNKLKTIDFLLIDLFCGGGGTTLGAEMSGRCKVVAAVNHDPVCILTHAENHPHCLHMQEDIRTLDISPILEALKREQAKHPSAKVILWASLECTNFSKAKGGLPRDADSRTLADHLPRYLQVINPDYVWIENVEEFCSWGDLDDNGKPCSRYEGKEYHRWVGDMCAFGYEYTSRLINSADFGAYTSRVRLFGSFHRPGMPFRFPEPTHIKPSKKSVNMFGFPAWKPVREVLDLGNVGRSIFNRSKPLVDKTILRITKGIKKFSPQPMVQVHNSPGYCTSLEDPCGTITVAGHKSLVTPFLASYYSNTQISSIEAPCNTIPTKDRFALVNPICIDYNYSGPHNNSSLDQPLGTITTSNKAAIIHGFMMNRSYNNGPRGLNEPAPTVIASQKSWPLELAFMQLGDTPVYQDHPGDSEAMKALKALCQELGIIDVTMRMLTVDELKVIQGFPAYYQLGGNQEQQKKMIGNSVVPLVVTEWLKAI